MPLKVIRNDITKLAADAIVNAANQQATVGTGVDAAIYNAAGYDALLNERKKIGKIGKGECRPTSGFALPCKYILHTVGTFWHGGRYGEENILRNCYRNSLNWAKMLDCKSVALPLLASGNFGYPKELTLKIAQEEINNFLAVNDTDVYLVVYDIASVVLSEAVFGQIDSYIDAHYIAVHEASTSVKEPSVKDVLGSQGESFQHMVLRIIEERGMKSSDVYTGANMDRKGFSKLKSNPDYHPSKLIAMSLAIGLKLEIREATALLATAGYTFSPSDRFDIIIRYCIEQKIYDCLEINLLLYEYGFEGIGQRLKSKDL